MRQQQVLFSDEVLLEDARVMKLDYILIEKNSEENLDTSLYGIRITKHLNNIVEADEVNGISTSRERVVSIIRKLCQHQVTPISMVEIVDDLVTQGI